MKVLFTQQQVDGLKTKHFSATLSEYLVLKFGDDVILCRYGFSEYASIHIYHLIPVFFNVCSSVEAFLTSEKIDLICSAL